MLYGAKNHPPPVGPNVWNWVDPLGLCKNSAERRAHLTNKFGRSGNLDKDISLRGYLEKVDTLDFSSSRHGSVFWSGPGNMKRATSFAKSTNKQTLEMSTGGVRLQNEALFKKLPPEMAIQPWQKASKKFAEGTSGVTNAFARGAKPDRVFYSIEHPALRSNPEVVDLIFR